MNNRRVVVTGLGTISCLGPDTSSFWDALSSGRHGFAPIESVDRCLLRSQNGAEVRGFQTERHFEKKKADVLDRFAQFAVVAAREAVADANVNWTPDLCDRSTIMTGSCTGGQTSEDKEFYDLYARGRQRSHPLTVPRVMANAGASAIAIEFGITGPAVTISTACASSNHAIGQAFWMVRNGQADLAIAGGSEAPFSLLNLKVWDAIRAVSTDICRPFALGRLGMTLGEGAAMLVLEPLDAALARGATVYAEVVGFGMSSDAVHMTQPQAEGAQKAMTRALADAELRPEQIGYINAHGTGTQANDTMETRAIRAVFQGHADRLAVSSTKSMHGHALGAASAFEAVATCLALKHQLLPPTANFTEPDPECDLDVVPNRARWKEVAYALSNSFAFGGLNAVLAFRRWNPCDESRFD
jgi:nodulation protein E